MNFIRKLLSTNTLLLLASFMLMLAFGGQYKEAFYDINKLQSHIGVINQKTLTTEKDDDISRTILYLTLDDKVNYKVSKFVSDIDRSINIGDSVRILTKSTITLFGNYVSSEDGKSIWTTHDKNEVYELYSYKDLLTYISFQQHKENLINMLWISPLFSLFFIGMYFYRRSGINSPFVFQSDD